MLFIKLTILATFVLFIWGSYISGKLKSDIIFNEKVNINHEYPIWYIIFCALVAIDVVCVFASLVYFLFVIWR